jgi:carboxypeptidase Q
MSMGQWAKQGSAMLALMIGVTACATPAMQSDALGTVEQQILDAARSGNQGYAIVEGLTTEVGQRLAGTEAEARARDWTVAKFNEIGLENVRVEPFTITGWERGVETATIVSPYPQDMLVTALGGSVATPMGGVTADIAYFPTFEDLSAAPMGGLDGKIVFISGLM